MKKLQMIGLSMVFVGLAVSPLPLLAVVVSDVPALHETAPGVPVFDLDHDGVGKASVHFDDGFVGTCTATLLRRGEGRFAILAGHCVGDGIGFSVTFVEVTWELAGGTVSAVASVAAGQIHIHPVYLANDLDVLKGNDVAILEFSEAVAPEVPRYGLYEGSGELASPFIVIVGYGLTGHGSTGAMPGTDGTKRFGLNRWEAVGLGALGAPLITNNEAQLTVDFDNGSVLNDAFGVFFGTVGTSPLGGDPIYDDPLGLGSDEVCGGVGDSGGPGFLFDEVGGSFEIAGVASYGTRLVDDFGIILTEPPADPPGSTTSDVDSTVSGSWGEFFVHSRLSHPTNKLFLDSVLPPEVIPDVFADDFETGDTSAWSSVVGES